MAQAQSVAMPTRFPLVQEQNNRGNSSEIDARMINAFGEKQGDDNYWVYKRPGLTTQISGYGPGLGAWNFNGSLYAANGGLFTQNGVPIGAIDGGHGTYWACQSQGDLMTIFIMNGQVAYTYDTTNGFVQVTDSHFPTNLAKGAVFLDGTTYVMNYFGTIFGSHLNDPRTWDPLSQIKAQVESDFGVALVKQQTFVVAMKNQSIEFFWDAANATGSPLSPNLPAKLSIGCASADSIQQMDADMFWLSNSKSASLQVWGMSGTTASKLSSKAVERILTSVSTVGMRSFCLKLRGHRFYGMVFPTTNLTLVLDVDEGLWSYWTDAFGNYFAVGAVSYFVNTYSLAQDIATGNMMSITEENTSDDYLPIPISIYTPNADMNIRRGKLLSKMEIIGDQQVNSTLYVSCSDDDYQTWSEPRSVNLSLARPILTRCGTFHRRAYLFQHVSNTPFHIKAIECQIDIGTL